MVEACRREVGLSVEEDIVFEIDLLCQLLEEEVLHEVLSFRNEIADWILRVLEVQVQTGREKN